MGTVVPVSGAQRTGHGAPIAARPDFVLPLISAAIERAAARAQVGNAGVRMNNSA